MKHFLLLIPFVAAGCTGSPAGSLRPPSYDPVAMTAAALKTFDKNGNGSLEGDELAACPALKASLARIDQNNDKKLSSDELKSRFTAYAEIGAGTISASVRVLLDGQPLADAKVTFTPEAFMGGAVRETSATTTADGSIIEFTIDGKTHPGPQAGLYRVTVAKDGLPEKARTQLLGCEFYEGGRDVGTPIEFRLTSR